MDTTWSREAPSTRAKRDQSLDLAVESHLEKRLPADAPDACVEHAQAILDDSTIPNFYFDSLEDYEDAMPAILSRLGYR